ncbi:hypothetical protein [Streptomyces sp. NPDC056672]|uniref:hypothetical protein n=1 Tax=Streptomyces sp. NPDC056672 TaxID=3345906 RepID=UPI0036B2D9A4
MDEPDTEEEAVVARIQAQDAAFAELDRQHRTYTVRGPIRVEVHSERFEVPLTVRDVQAALRQNSVRRSTTRSTALPRRSPAG